MRDLDDLFRPILVLGGVFLGIWTFYAPLVGFAVGLVIAGIASSSLIQSAVDFEQDPVFARHRMEVWPLIQIPIGALVTLVALLVAASDVVAPVFGVDPSAETQKGITTIAGGAISAAILGIISYWFGENNARLGARHRFKKAIAELEFENGSRGYQAQFLDSIDGIVGTVGWGFRDRAVRARVAKDELAAQRR